MTDTEIEPRVTLYSHLWPFYGGRQWHGVELVPAFGWSVVSYYEERKGFSIETAHETRDDAIEELNERLEDVQAWRSVEGLRIEQTEETDVAVDRREFECVMIYSTVAKHGSGHPIYYLHAVSDLGGRQIVGILDKLPIVSGTYLVKIPTTLEPVAVTIDLEKVTVV